MNEIFKELAKHALKADSVGNSRHSTAIVHKGKILSIGLNRRKTHPLQKLFSDRPERLYIHSEIDAITKIKNKTILKECDVYVLRLTKGGHIGNSKPCEGCKKALTYYGIQGIYWTEDE